MKAHALYFVVICAVVAATHSLSAPAMQTGNPDAPRKWEHLSMTHAGITVDKEPRLSKQIIELGEQGWELVTVSNVIQEGNTLNTVFYFKRPK